MILRQMSRELITSAGLDALPEDCRPSTIEEGNLAQNQLVIMHAKDKRKPIGWKVGATGLAAQKSWCKLTPSPTSIHLTPSV